MSSAAATPLARDDPARADAPAAADAPAIRVHADDGFGLDVAELWRFRGLLWGLATRDLKLRYKQTLLGVLWVILQPLAAALIFTFPVRHRRRPRRRAERALLPVRPRGA